VSFPLLLASTPGASGYLAFYQAVAAMVRGHGMTLSVEENPVFSGTPLTPLDISYAGLTPDSYAAEARQQAQMIIDDLHPAYLSIMTEPDTYSAAMNLPLTSPPTLARVVSEELAGLRRGSTRVGAGAGTWSGPGPDRALLSTPIDYLDVHVYPLAPAALSTLSTVVGAARAAGKPLVMDEAWLYKAYTDGRGGLPGATQEQKDVGYGFWAPLDERFVRDMTEYAGQQGFAYLSFFDGARAFFGYLDWTPALDAASYAAFIQQYDELVGAHMRRNVWSGTGQELHRLLSAG